MSLITRMRKQKAIYWKQREPGPDGQLGYYHGVEIRCRWDDVIKKVVKANGEEYYSRSTVYVDRDMKPGDLLQYAGVISVSNPVAEEVPYSEGEVVIDPRENGSVGIVEVQTFSSIPKLNASEFLRIANI